VSSIADRELRTRNPRGQGERLRTDLLAAAIDLLAERESVEDLSVRAVTARAGVSANALYLHFADREELLSAVRERCFAELRSYVLAGESAAAPDGEAQARAMCLAYLRFARERPGHYRVLFHVRRGTGPDCDEDAPKHDLETIPEGGAEAFGDLVRAVGRCLPAGADPIESACVVWAGLHGSAAIHHTMPGFPMSAPERFVADVLAGVTATAAAAR
jgi:AcrR family transcriptional regulator